MKIQRRTNLLWGLLFFSIALILLLNTFDVIPSGLYDLLVRAWPALFIVFGVSTLLRPRIPLSGAIAIVVSALLVGGMAAVAYTNRAEEERSDQLKAITQTISEEVNLLEISLETLMTDVEVESSPDRAAGITGEFVGSTESVIAISYAEGTDNRATFTVRETRPDQFPNLEAVGRGVLRLQIPTDIAVAISFAGEDGEVTFNMSDLALERLSLVTQNGNVLVTMPEYAPLSPNAAEQPGNITARNGAVTLFIPEAVAVRLSLEREGSEIRPEFDENIYRYLEGDTLEARTYETADIRLNYVITAPNGLIRVENAAGSS
ncbi:MAG: hypothetical protein H7Y09_10620 [Chitinophagaceae bacterium]|nr:hypothetical protein [Anaerolineae bacterium]